MFYQLMVSFGHRYFGSFFLLSWRFSLKKWIAVNGHLNMQGWLRKPCRRRVRRVAPQYHQWSGTWQVHGAIITAPQIHALKDNDSLDNMPTNY
jgi:hypothetical protein